MEATAHAQIRARTEDGREVILRKDGTWSFANEPAKDRKSSTKVPRQYTKPKEAVEQYRGKRGTFALWLVPGVWTQMKPGNDIVEAQFRHKDGAEALVMVIAERLTMSRDALKNFVIANVRKADPNAKVVKEETRTVNGKEVLCMTTEANLQGIAFTYYGYYYTGKAGTVQVITFTGQNLFADYKSDMEAFLNGLEIIEKK
jgi:hypothetical protein